MSGTLRFARPTTCPKVWGVGLRLVGQRRLFAVPNIEGVGQAVPNDVKRYKCTTVGVIKAFIIFSPW